MSEEKNKPDNRQHDFGWATEKMQEGLCVEREVWCGRKIVFLREGRTIDHVDGPLRNLGVTTLTSMDHFCMLVPDEPSLTGNTMVVGWQPLPWDVLGIDWRVSNAVGRKQ